MGMNMQMINTIPTTMINIIMIMINTIPTTMIKIIMTMMNTIPTTMIMIVMTMMNTIPTNTMSPRNPNTCASLKGPPGHKMITCNPITCMSLKGTPDRNNTQIHNHNYDPSENECFMCWVYQCTPFHCSFCAYESCAREGGTLLCFSCPFFQFGGTQKLGSDRQQPPPPPEPGHEAMRHRVEKRL